MAPTIPRRIGIFGGTFDPIHLGHLIVASELRFALKLERVLFVLAPRPPHKTAQEISDYDDRLAMLRLALASVPDFEISATEHDRPGLSFTADTLALLSPELAPARLFFLMGGDSLRDFPTWHEPDRIATLAELGVAARPNVEPDVSRIEQEVPAARDRIHLVPVPLIGISSREIRRRVRAGEPIRFQVPLTVETYIRARGLYLPPGQS